MEFLDACRDCERCFRRTWKRLTTAILQRRSKEEVLVSYPFVEAIAVQRLAHELYLKTLR